jgi:capsular exopolysaccharide synthesis family protein
MMQVQSNQLLPGRRLPLHVELPRFGDEPVILGDSPEIQPAADAYRSLRTRVMRFREERRAKAIAITSAAKSEGKTLTAFNLACCCAQIPNFTVLMVDADLRDSGLTRLTGARLSPGLRELLADNAESFDEAIASTDINGLFMLGAGTQADPAAELFSSASWGKLIAWARESFDLVLVDSSPTGLVADSELIEAACDALLLVVRAHRTNQLALERALGQINLKKLLGVVWNEDTHSAGDYGYQYGRS